MPAGAPTRYNLSFTAAPLRPELARIVAAAFLETGDWERTRQRILSTNALQATTKRSAERLELEFRLRLSTLTPEQFTLLAHATGEDAAALAWLAAFKNSRFAFEFAAEVLRDKLAAGDPVLRRSDYESYVETKATLYENLAALSDSSRERIRQVLLRMCREAGLLARGPDHGRIQRPVLSADVRRAVAADDPRLLAGFLVPDAEIEAA